ncbi:metallopeptidase [Astrocystis sublimbata]|nr:metallopeptidase [Astrocystis sublimbata]
MAFNLKQFRRRSLASFRTSRSTDTSSNDEPSSSSQELSSVGSITPPSLADDSDPSLHTQLSAATTRPPLEPRTNRYSVAESVISEPRSTKDGQQDHFCPPNLTQYAPEVTSIRNKSTVHQKILLVKGLIGRDPHPQIEGAVSIFRPDKTFPSVMWPVQGARFKALLYLSPGPNTFCLEYRKPGARMVHHSSLTLYMFDPKNAPPLQLAILVAKDSPFAIEQAPACEQEEMSDLEAAICKFRAAAYLWQSFIAEQMDKNGLGRRTIRFDEEWTSGTSHMRDFDEHTMRSEARVHVVRMDTTVAQMYSLEHAHQSSGDLKQNSLANVAATALKEYFRMVPGQKQYVAALVLDKNPDMQESMTMDQTVFGGHAGDGLQLAMFGSQCLQYYPATISDTAKTFMNCSQTHLKTIVNGVNLTGSSWEAATYGMSAHLREVGHLLGSSHQGEGVMAPDFATLNRAFMMREAYCTRTKSKGGPVETKDEPAWHRLDLLKFRFHPLFRNPTDRPLHPDNTLHGWVVDKDKLLVNTSTGLLCVEMYAENDEFCTTWHEMCLDTPMCKRVTLVEAEMRARLPEGKRNGKVKVIVRSVNGGELVVDDLHQLCADASVKLNSGLINSKMAYRSTAVGSSKLDNSEPQEVIFNNALASVNRILARMTIYHGDAVDGLEFHYDDGSSQLLGKRGGKPGGDRFSMEIHNAEMIAGFAVRAGSWIDAIQIITSMGRRSPVYGKADGGSLRTLFVPNGYKICGLRAGCADWLNNLSLIITR